ncbi:putative lipoprotein, partial [Fusobacterium sp. CM21]
MKKFIALCTIVFILSGCVEKSVPKVSSSVVNEEAEAESDKNIANITVKHTDSSDKISDIPSESFSFINPSGKTLVKRILTPEGYKRIKAKKGSFT